MAKRLTWLGHATWLLELDSHRVLIDPFLTDNPSATLSPDELDVEFILLTHGHFDHVADAASIAKRCGAKLIANYEIATWFAEKHLIQDTLGMNLGGRVKLPFGTVQMTVAHHSSQLPDGSYGGNPGGYMIHCDRLKIYFAGDTALFSDLRLYGEPAVDVAVLPIGDLFTMGPEESVAAIKLLHARHVFPSHYNTWPPIEQSAAEWAKMVRQQTESLPHTPAVGQAVEIE